MAARRGPRRGKKRRFAWIAVLAAGLLAPDFLPAAMTMQEFRRFVEETFGSPSAVVTAGESRPSRDADVMWNDKKSSKKGKDGYAKTWKQAPAVSKRRGPSREVDLVVIPRGETVRSRLRPAYDALGLRAGGFILFPSLAVSEVYDDNIFRDRDGTEGDFITVLQPRMRLASDWSNHALAVEVGAALGFYAANPDENYEDFHARADGRLDITAVSQLRGTVGIEKLHSDRDSPDDSDALDPTEYYAYSAGADYVRNFGRIRLILGGEMNRLDYLDNERLNLGVVEELNNDDRDRIEALGRTRIAYQFKPDSGVYLESSVGRLVYDSGRDDNGFDRDALTMRTVVGVESDVDGILSGDLYAGYLAKEFDDDRLGSIDGFSVGGKLTWNVTALTTVTADAERGITPTTIANASGAIFTRAGITVDHELLRNVILQVRTQWRENDYDGIDRVDETFRVGIGADFLVNRNLTVSADYSHGERISSEPDPEYSQNQFVLQLKAKF